MFNYKSILITGGTGSFGKKFIETILENYSHIEKIIVFSRDEYKQFQMANTEPFKNDSRLRFFIGDVRDRDRLYRAFNGVDVVIHAAALKQVPSCEYNPFEAIKTNVLGAQNVIDAAIDRNVKKVIALSTDKACSPINLYGATKLCSDKLFVAGNVYTGSSNTRFSVVRYGNVIGSRGSVIPFFKELLQVGAQELPITDYKMTRFWLKLEEAVEMVLKALDIMQGGEIFVKKVPSMKIIDLASVIAPDKKLKEIGIRPGEKLHELLISGEDALHTVDSGDYFTIYPSYKFPNCVIENKVNFLKYEFEYSSETNDRWITPIEMKQMLNDI